MSEQPQQPTFVDPALGAAAMQPPAGGAPAAGTSLLETLQKGFRKQAKILEVEVTDADGNPWLAVFDAVIPYESYTAWVLAAADTTAPGGVNQLTLAANGLVHQLKHLSLDGQVLAGGDGPITFDSEQMWRLLDAIDGTDAVRKFFRSDGAVLFASQELLKEAGYTPPTPQRR